MVNKFKRKVILFIITAFLLSCGERDISPTGEQTDDREIIKVRAVEAVSGNIEKSISLNGEVLATGVVRITPDTAGVLSELMIRPGDPVEEGQIIAMVDPSRPGLSYTESPVKSKARGTVIRVMAIEGNQVSPQVVIAETGNLEDLEIECRIPERYLPLLSPGLSARISSRAYPDTPVTARISEIAPIVDPDSRTVLVTLKPQSSRTIRPGQSVNVELVTESRRNVLLIPDEAVTERNGGRGVFLLSGGTALWQKVSEGLSQSGMTEIREGLSEGDLIAVAGIDLLTDGIAVQVVR